MLPTARSIGRPYPNTRSRSLARCRAARFCLVPLALLLIGAARTPERPPNIVLIIGDDVGYADYGFMGSKVAKTPHIDRLAAEGTVFPMGFVTASMCAPSLRSLLTGLHPIQLTQRVAQIRAAAGAPPSDEWTRMRGELRLMEPMPGRLGEQGYVSFQSGKYWEWSYKTAGFTQGMSYGKHGIRATGEIGRKTMKPVFDFIDENQDKPFFLWFAPILPHTPFDAPKIFESLYRDHDLSAAELGYFANLTRLDYSVGQLMSHIAKRELDEDTIVIYLGDNGWDSALSQPARAKATSYELGLRTPVIFRGPGRFGPNVVREEIISALDLVPTILELAGAPKMEKRIGSSLVPLLEGGKRDTPNVHFGGLFANNGPDRVAPGSAEVVTLVRRDMRWYYIHGRPGDMHELYDMKVDPRQHNNVAAQHPARVQQFSREADQWRQKVRSHYAVPD